MIQQYVPRYRAPMFYALKKSLKQQGIDLYLLSGRPHSRNSVREDEAALPDICTVVDERRLNFLGYQVSVKSLSTVLSSFHPDFVIVEQAVKNLESLALLFGRRRTRDFRVGMWGQGRQYSTPSSHMTLRVKRRLTRQADWFFAYTSSGKDYVVSQGFNPERVTVLHNTIDTDALSSDIASVSPGTLADFRSRHKLCPGATALFLGGVDQSKGIEFLLATAREVHRMLPSFKLLVGGAGQQAELVRRSQDSGDPVVYLGRLDGPEKALALCAADIMMIPQWVGLVAVDSLVAGKPIVTTDHPSHSPEFEYLIDCRNSLVSKYDVAAYARKTFGCLQDTENLNVLQSNARVDSRRYSLQSMVERFTIGMTEWRESS